MQPDAAPSRFGSVLRGALGFGAVSLVAYGVWAFAGKALSRSLGEGGFYAVLVAVFVGLTGLALHPLVAGPRSFLRFTRVFVPAFIAYAGVWCAFWFKLKFGLGEWLGSLGGTVAFALVAAATQGGRRSLPHALLVIFVGHSAGYFLGAPICYSQLKTRPELGMLAWGLLYGLGFGAGIGFLFHALQQARRSET
jgi:hypothetical protein